MATAWPNRSRASRLPGNRMLDEEIEYSHERSSGTGGAKLALHPKGRAFGRDQDLGHLSGTSIIIQLYPALKRWAKLVRPLRGWLLASGIRRNHAMLALTQTLRGQSRQSRQRLTSAVTAAPPKTRPFHQAVKPCYRATGFRSLLKSLQRCPFTNTSARSAVTASRKS
jgi:hypothetical protein